MSQKRNAYAGTCHLCGAALKADRGYLGQRSSAGKFMLFCGPEGLDTECAARRARIAAAKAKTVAAKPAPTVAVQCAHDGCKGQSFEPTDTVWRCWQHRAAAEAVRA